MKRAISVLAVVMLAGCAAVQRGPDAEKHPWSGKKIVFSNDPEFPDRILLNYSYDCPASSGPRNGPGLPVPDESVDAGLAAASYAGSRMAGNIRFRDVAGKKTVVEGIDGSLRMKFVEEEKYICYDLQESRKNLKEKRPPNHAFFEEDIENIREMTGKTVWVKGCYVNTAKTGYHKDKTLNLYNAEPVIITGFCAPTPYYFFVEVENSKGQKGCIPLDNRLDLQTAFFIKNPINPEWDKKTVDTIRAGSFFIGMPAGALRTSWGNPKKINRTISRDGVHEQWIYGDWGPYIYLNNGKVVSREG